MIQLVDLELQVLYNLVKEKVMTNVSRLLLRVRSSG